MLPALLLFSLLLGCEPGAIIDADVDSEELGIDMSGVVDLHPDSSFEVGVDGYHCNGCILSREELADAPLGRFVAHAVGTGSTFSLGDWPGVANVAAGWKVLTQIRVRGQDSWSARRRGALCLRERDPNGVTVATRCSSSFSFGSHFHAVGISHAAVGTGIVDAYVYLTTAQAGNGFYADDFVLGVLEPASAGDAGQTTPAPDAGQVPSPVDAGQGPPSVDAGHTTPAPDAGQVPPAVDAGPTTPTPDAGQTPPASGSPGEISAANQAVIVYPPNQPSLSTLMAYAHPGGMVVIDQALLAKMTNGGRDFVRDFQEAGGEVLLYIDLMEVPDYQVNDAARFGIFSCSGMGSCAATMPASYFFPHYVNGTVTHLSNWPQTYLTDVTTGSAFSNNVVQFLKTWDRVGAKGFFLDVLGTRLWTPAWTAMSASEQTAWTNGVYDLVSRLRAALGDDVILVANNTWNNGHPGLNGFCIEHHDFSEASFFQTMIATKPWHAGRRHIVIASGASQAQSWRSVSGVTDITPQLDYSQQPLPVSTWPFTAPR
jgi:hypothetical protein